MAGVNFIRGSSASSFDPEKGHADKETILNTDCLSNTLAVDRNIH